MELPGAAAPRFPRGIENLINQYFGCQIRDQRGRFTPGGFVLEKFFENVDFFQLLNFVESTLVENMV